MEDTNNKENEPFIKQEKIDENVSNAPGNPYGREILTRSNLKESLYRRHSGGRKSLTSSGGHPISSVISHDETPISLYDLPREFFYCQAVQRKVKKEPSPSRPPNTNNNNNNNNSSTTNSTNNEINTHWRRLRKKRRIEDSDSSSDDDSMYFDSNNESENNTSTTSYHNNYNSSNNNYNNSSNNNNERLGGNDNDETVDLLLDLTTCDDQSQLSLKSVYRSKLKNSDSGNSNNSSNNNSNNNSSTARHDISMTDSQEENTHLKFMLKRLESKMQKVQQVLLEDDGELGQLLSDNNYNTNNTNNGNSNNNSNNNTGDSISRAGVLEEVNQVLRKELDSLKRTVQRSKTGSGSRISSSVSSRHNNTSNSTSSNNSNNSSSNSGSSSSGHTREEWTKLKSRLRQREEQHRIDKTKIVSLQQQNETFQEKSMLLDSLLAQLETTESEKRKLQQTTEEYNQQKKLLENSLKDREIKQVHLIQQLRRVEQQLQLQQQQQQQHQQQQQQQQRSSHQDMHYDDLLRVFMNTRNQLEFESSKVEELEKANKVLWDSLKELEQQNELLSLSTQLQVEEEVLQLSQQPQHQQHNDTPVTMLVLPQRPLSSLLPPSPNLDYELLQQVQLQQQEETEQYAHRLEQHLIKTFSELKRVRNLLGIPSSQATQQ